VQFDPVRALHNKNVEIKEDFLRRFERDFQIDNLVDSLELD
jgi:hypothetical protein